MKKLLTAALFCAGSLFATDSSLFNGTWLVDDEGISITFEDSTKVSYDSDDESVVGEGTYSYDDTTLTANIVNEDMDMAITYLYESDGEGLKVKTIAVVVSGDTLNSNDEWYTITRKEEK